PRVVKLLLLLLCGAAAVWLFTLVFFQAVLLGGYAFAHVSIRLLGLRRQTVAQLLLALLPLPFLPIALPAHASPPSGSPTLWLLGLLAATAGLPFFVVTTASPVLQRWFSASGDEAARDPYFLYAAGNAGSLLPLLSVVPLALDLLSFVVAFARRQPRSLRTISVLAGLSALATAASILRVVPLPVPALVVVHAASLFLLALLVHRRLAEERPAVERLTEFYLLLSLGGVVGGIFNALLAPRLFSTIAEYPLAIALALLLRPRPEGTGRTRALTLLPAVIAFGV